MENRCFYILDLKKLIKYEQRVENKENDQSRAFNAEDIYSILHSTRTMASQAKEVKKKASTITVEVKKISKENKQATVDESENKESSLAGQCCCNQKTKPEEETAENEMMGDGLYKSKSCGKLSSKSVVSKHNVKAKASCKYYRISKYNVKAKALCKYYRIF